MRRWVAIAIGLWISVASPVRAAAAPPRITGGDLTVGSRFLQSELQWPTTMSLAPGFPMDSVATIGGVAVPNAGNEGIIPCGVPGGSQPIEVTERGVLIAAGTVTVHARPPLPPLLLTVPGNGNVGTQGGATVDIGPVVGTRGWPPWGSDTNGVTLRGATLPVSQGAGEYAVTLPDGAASGMLRVHYCTQTESVPLHILPPVIEKISAAGGSVTPSGGGTSLTAGSSIWVVGSDFAEGQGSNQLLLDGTPLADIRYWAEGGGIEAVIPPTTPAGTYEVSVKTGGGTSNAVPIHVVTSSAVLLAGPEVPGEAPPPSAMAGNGGTTSGAGGSSTASGAGGTGGSSRTMSIDGPAMLHGTGTYRVSPASAGVMWASSDPPVIEIDPVTGVATALQPGTATISAVAGGHGATLKVVAVPAPKTATPIKARKTGTAKTLGLYGGATALAGLLLLALRRRRHHGKK